MHRAGRPSEGVEGLIWVAQLTPLRRRAESANFAFWAATGTVWVTQTSGLRGHRLSLAQGTRGGGSCAKGGAS